MQGEIGWMAERKVEVEFDATSDKFATSIAKPKFRRERQAKFGLNLIRQASTC